MNNILMPFTPITPHPAAPTPTASSAVITHTSSRMPNIFTPKLSTRPKINNNSVHFTPRKRAVDEDVEYEDKQPKPSVQKTPRADVQQDNRQVAAALASDSSYIIALAELRSATPEIGMAVHDIDSGEFILMQHGDNHAYGTTLAVIATYLPREILIPATAEGGDMHAAIKDAFPDVSVFVLGRKYFNEKKGLQGIKHYAHAQCSIDGLDDSSKYLCLAAAAALLKYAEHTECMSFAAKSLNVSYRAANGCMLLNASTIFQLEVISSTRHDRGSLYSILNTACTPQGARFLRSTLIQPPAVYETIMARQQAVEELITSDHLFTDLKIQLKKLCDLDKLISNFIKINNKNAGQNDLKNIISLKQSLHVLATLGEVIDKFPVTAPLLQSIHQAIKDPECSVISSEIESIIVPELLHNASTTIMRIQESFAVQMGVDGLLDVARKTLTDVQNEMSELVDEYRKNIADVKLIHNARRGWFLTCPTSVTLPANFIERSNKGKRQQFTSNELASLSVRFRETEDEIRLLSNKVIADLVASIRSKISSMYIIAEAVALLDCLLCLANYSKSSQTSTPKVSDSGPLAIVQGRHPIMERLSQSTFVANDVFISEVKNLQVITGPNMSGKTTYITQAGLIVILAQIGCRVPTEFAHVPIYDRIFTRIGCDDDIQNNSSSAMTEFRDMAYILKSVTNKSLVLIDELGKSTSDADGIGMAWSVCEYLSLTEATTFFTTHYTRLCDLESMYPNVVNKHFIVEKVDDKIQYCYNISDGSCTDQDYGIQTAALIGMPTDIIEMSRDYISKRRKNSDTASLDRSQSRDHKICDIVERLLNLKNSSLPENQLKTLILALRDEAVEVMKISDDMPPPSKQATEEYRNLVRSAVETPIPQPTQIMIEPIVLPISVPGNFDDLF